MTSAPHCRTDLVLGGIGGGDARRAHRREAEELERHRHRVGGELAAAGAGARTDVVLELLQVGVAHLAGGIGADGLEDVLDGDVVTLEAARAGSSRRRGRGPAR